MANRKKKTKVKKAKAKAAPKSSLYVDRYELRLRDGEREKLHRARKRAKLSTLAAYIRAQLGLAA